MSQKSSVPYTYWRGDSLYLRIPPKSKLNPGSDYIREPVAQRLSETKAEEERCYEIARDVMSKFRTDVIEGTFFQIQDKPANPKIWRLVGLYMKLRVSHVKSPHGPKNMMRKILKKFGKRYARSISTEEVLSWLKEFIDRGWEISCVNFYRNFFSAIFNTWNKSHTEEKDNIKNPITKIKHFPGGNIRDYYLDPDKFQRYLTVAYDIDKNLGDFWRGGWELGGRRPTEIARYDHARASLTTGEITVIGKFTKKGEPDKVAMSPWMRGYIEKIPINERIGRIFKTSNGKAWTPDKWQSMIVELRRRVGDPDVWFRDYRRGFITTRLRDKEPLKDVMQASGHKDEKTVLRYYQPSADAKKRMVEAASADLKGLDDLMDEHIRRSKEAEKKQDVNSDQVSADDTKLLKEAGIKVLLSKHQPRPMMKAAQI